MGVNNSNNQACEMHEQTPACTAQTKNQRPECMMVDTTVCMKGSKWCLLLFRLFSLLRIPQPPTLTGVEDPVVFSLAAGSVVLPNGLN